MLGGGGVGSNRESVVGGSVRSRTIGPGKAAGHQQLVVRHTLYARIL